MSTLTVEPTVAPPEFTIQPFHGMVVDILDEDVKGAIRGRPIECPVARALLRITGEIWFVGSYAVPVVGPGSRYGVRQMTREAIARIYEYDTGADFPLGPLVLWED